LILDKLLQRMSFLQLPFFGVEVQCLIRRVDYRRDSKSMLSRPNLTSH